MGFQQAEEVGAKQDGKRAVLRCTCLRRARRVVEQRQFAEKTPLPQLGDLAARRLPLAADQHLAGFDDIERLALLALVENDFILEKAALVQQAVHGFQFARTERGKQRQRPQLLETGRVFFLAEQKHDCQIPL